MWSHEENLKCIEIAKEESRKMMEEYNKKCSIPKSPAKEEIENTVSLIEVLKTFTPVCSIPKSLKTRSFPSDLEIRILENSIKSIK